MRFRHTDKRREAYRAYNEGVADKGEALGCLVRVECDDQDGDAGAGVDGDGQELGLLAGVAHVSDGGGEGEDEAWAC